MPRIKAYKQADKLIPVDTAKIVTAFQCPWTKKTFITKKAYVKHLKTLREERIHRRIKAARLEKMINDLNNQTSWTEMIEWIERNSHFFLARAKQNNLWRGDYRTRVWPDPEDFWVRITMLDIQHTPTASCTHSAPRGKKTNWGREADRPIHYPGWVGRIEWQVSHDLPGFGSDVFKGTGLHVGSGGGSSNNRYGFSVTFWDEDWPRMDEGRTYEALSGRNCNTFRYGKSAYFR